MGDNNGITNPLCEARMKNVDDKLSNIKETADNIEKKVDDLSDVCNQIPINTKRLDLLEKFKDNFSFTRVLLFMALIAGAITTIGEFVKKLITHQF